MRKADAPAFAEFMDREAAKYDRPVTPQEITLWFENFSRATLEEFKTAWKRHQDGRYGHLFPKIVDLQRALKADDDNEAKRDWRCSEEIGTERCGYPGGILVGGPALCSAHYKIKGTSTYTTEASLQIIEASRTYTPPKTAMEWMERGAKLREIEGTRWREGHPEIYAEMKTRQQINAGLFVRAVAEVERVAAARPKEEPLPELEFDAVNQALDVASQESAA